MIPPNKTPYCETCIWAWLTLGFEHSPHTTRRFTVFAVWAVGGNSGAAATAASMFSATVSSSTALVEQAASGTVSSLVVPTVLLAPLPPFLGLWTFVFCFKPGLCSSVVAVPYNSWIINRKGEIQCQSLSKYVRGGWKDLHDH